MIEYLRGEVTHLTPVSAVIECSGVGYLASISLTTYRELQERCHDGRSPQLLYIHEVIREDTHELYGFCDEVERRLFRLLISVSGIGPASGRLMLSTYPPRELARYIAERNEQALQSVKGVGAKTAQRVIVELKDRVLVELGSDAAVDLPEHPTISDTPNRKEIRDEAERAFVTLGYPLAAARKVVAKLMKEQPTIELNDIIRQGLRMI